MCRSGRTAGLANYRHYRYMLSFFKLRILVRFSFVICLKMVLIKRICFTILLPNTNQFIGRRMAVHICVDYSLIRIIGGIRRFYIAVVAVFVLLKIPPDSSLIGLFPAFIVTGNCACFDITSYADSGIFGFRRKTFSASVGGNLYS